MLARPAAVLAIGVLALALAVSVLTRDAPARRPSGGLGTRPSGGRPAGARHVTPRGVILATFGHGWLGRCFLSIAWRESTMRPHATNWTDHHSDGSVGSFGLFQIGAVHRRAGEPVSAFRLRMLDPRANARAARRLYLSDGLSPWGGRC